MGVDAAAKADPTKKEIVEDMDHALWPVGPVGHPTEFQLAFPILAACAFLVSEEAGYITGPIVGVHGGRNT